MYTTKLISKNNHVPMNGTREITAPLSGPDNKWFSGFLLHLRKHVIVTNLYYYYYHYQYDLNPHHLILTICDPRNQNQTLCIFRPFYACPLLEHSSLTLLHPSLYQDYQDLPHYHYQTEEGYLTSYRLHCYRSQEECGSWE